MPIRIRCPGCESVLSAREDFQGKRVRCPKCGDGVSVPWPDERQEAAPSRPAERVTASAPRLRRAYGDDQPRRRRDEADERPHRSRYGDKHDDDHRPQRRRRSDSGSQNLGVILVCAGGALLLAVGVGLTLWLTLRSPGAAKPGGDDARNDKDAIENPKPKIDRNANALAFNQKIVEGNKRLQSAGFDLGVAMRNYISQGGQDTQSLRDACQRVLDTVDGVRKETATWAVPPAKSAQDLFDGYQRFLNLQTGETQKLAKVVSTLEGAKWSLDQKKQRLDQSTREFEAAERAQLPELQRLQRVFAQEHKIMLLPQ